MKKVLIAENYQPVRDLLSMVVSQFLLCEYDVSEDYNAVIEKASSSNYDLVIIDMSIQNYFSRCLIKSIRQMLAGSTILIMVDDGDNQTAKAGLNSGADHCLYKPFSIKELLQTISPILITQAQEQDGSLDSIRKFITSNKEQIIQPSMIE